MRKKVLFRIPVLWIFISLLPWSTLAQAPEKENSKPDLPAAGRDVKGEELQRLVQIQADLLKQQAAQIAQLQAEVARQAAQVQRLDFAMAQTKPAVSPISDPGQKTATAASTASSAPSPAAPPTPAKGEKKEAPGLKLPEWLGRTTLSGTSYMRYSRELQAGMKDANAFAIDRIYFIFRSQLTDRVSLRLTMEGADKRDSAGYFDIATKHFFIDVAKFPFSSSHLLAGLNDLPWVPYEEGIWGYRFQGTVFADREGYLTSTDLGLSWKVDFPQKFGDFHFSVVNGEGWTKPEAGKYKDAHLRVTLSPIHSGWAKDFFIGAFGSVGNYDGIPVGQPSDRQRVILQGGYRGKHLRLMTSYLWANDPASQMKAKQPSLAARGNQLAHARGLSAFAVVNLGFFGNGANKWELITRHDRLDPDRAIPNDSHRRWVFGASYRWNQHVQTLLDYERVLVDSGALRPFERRIMLQNEVRF